MIVIILFFLVPFLGPVISMIHMNLVMSDRRKWIHNKFEFGLTFVHITKSILIIVNLLLKNIHMVIIVIDNLFLLVKKKYCRWLKIVVLLGFDIFWGLSLVYELRKFVELVRKVFRVVVICNVRLK